MKHRKRLLVLGTLFAVAATLSLWPRQSKAVPNDCFATVIGCGKAWIKTCVCAPN